MVSSADNAQADGHAQNMLHNLRSQLIQFNDYQRVVKQEANGWNMILYMTVPDIL